MCVMVTDRVQIVTFFSIYSIDALVVSLERDEIISS